MMFGTAGVPHLVIGVDDIELVDPPTRGRALRPSPQPGPEGANVNFIARQPSQDDLWLIRTFERGVEAETLACGTGTVAAAVAWQPGGTPGCRWAFGAGEALSSGWLRY